MEAAVPKYCKIQTERDCIRVGDLYVPIGSSGDLQGIFRGSSGDLQGIFRGSSGDLQGSLYLVK
jgi:hypothetical protein